jgi:hypothetical protein
MVTCPKGGAGAKRSFVENAAKVRFEPRVSDARMAPIIGEAKNVQQLLEF